MAGWEGFFNGVVKRLFALGLMGVASANDEGSALGLLVDIRERIDGLPVV